MPYWKRSVSGQFLDQPQRKNKTQKLVQYIIYLVWGILVIGKVSGVEMIGGYYLLNNYSNILNLLWTFYCRNWLLYSGNGFLGIICNVKRQTGKRKKCSFREVMRQKMEQIVGLERLLNLFRGGFFYCLAFKFLFSLFLVSRCSCFL